MRILIIIPAYNEEASLESVIYGIKQHCSGCDYVVINDCSTDSTTYLCRKMGFNHITLPINLGIGGAVQCGYMYAMENDYDFAIQIDGDGQHDPSFVEELLAPLRSGEADLSIGSRFLKKQGYQSSFFRRCGILLIKHVIKLCCGVSVLDTTSGFRAANKHLIRLYADEYAHDYPEPEAIVAAILSGYRVKEVPVSMNERQGGKSSIDLLRAVYYMVKVPISLVIYKLSVGKSKKIEV